MITLEQVRERLEKFFGKADQPRDEQGRFSSGGGGKSDAKSTLEQHGYKDTGKNTKSGHDVYMKPGANPSTNQYVLHDPKSEMWEHQSEGGHKIGSGFGTKQLGDHLIAQREKGEAVRAQLKQISGG